MPEMNSRLEPSATTCFTIACVAFSFVAITTIWRQSNSASVTNNANEATERLPRSRPQPQRRVAAGSLYAETREENTQRPTPGHERRAQIANILSQSSRVTQLLQSQHDASDARELMADLLGELCLLTSSLFQLQQELAPCSTPLIDNAGLSACFDAAIGSIQATLLLLEGSLGQGNCNRNALARGSEQLRSQRPVLAFLLSQLQSSEVPPTPPSETEVAVSLKDADFLRGRPSPTTSVNRRSELSPDIDNKSWAEPPPEYSPPTSDLAAVLAEKSDTKVETPMPMVASPERENSPPDASGLYDAVSNNDYQALEELLGHDADPSIPFGVLQRTPLHHAAHLNHSSLLPLLLQHGAVMSLEDAKGDTALHLAAWNGNVEALSSLLSHGADVDWLSGRDGYSSLWCVISSHQIDAARLLLRHGARVNLRAASSGGLTPLHQAAVTGQSAMCELLLERGAQSDCLDEDKNTPLHHAAAAGSEATVRILLRRGADVEALQAHGLTALHWAAHKGHSEVLSVLLDFGAQVDSKTEGDGATPLHLAANRGQISAARALLNRGAKRNIVAVSWDGASGTPAEIAQIKGHERLAKVLR